MDFARSGMLGVVVICIALAGALFGAYLAGIDTEEREYTAYEYLADMSGEFEYDQSPQFIDFDPNTNYIGYYSTDTGDAFPQDKVDFVRYEGGVNNYAIKLPDILLDEGTDVELDNFEVTGRVDLKTTQYYGTLEEDYHLCIRPAIQTLAEFIADNLPDVTNTQKVHIKSPEAMFEPESGDRYFTADWIFITRAADWSDSNNRYKCCTPEYKVQNPTTTLPIPCLSCKVNMVTHTVDRYYDNNYEQYCDTLDLSECKIVYGGVDRIVPTVNYAQFHMSETFDYEVYKVLEYVYMDPTRGVALKD